MIGGGRFGGGLGPLAGVPPMGGSSLGGNSGRAWEVSVDRAVVTTGIGAIATLLGIGCSGSCVLREDKFSASSFAVGCAAVTGP